MPWKSLIVKRGHVCSISEDKRKPGCGNKKPRHHHANQHVAAEGYDTEYSSAYGRNYSTPHYTQQQQQQLQHQQQQSGIQNLEQYMSQCESRCELLRQQQQFSYDPNMQRECQWSQRMGDQLEQSQYHTRRQHSPRDFQLYERTPAPIMDKHYRGAHYQPGHRLAVQVSEEVSRVRDTRDGPVRISCEEDYHNSYLPMYKYKDWVQRSELEVWQDCNTSALMCRMPEAPTQYWDFYNEARMNRPAKKLLAPTFGRCRVIPIPCDKDLENVHEYDCYGGQCMQNQGFQGQENRMASLCRC